jgi:RNA polymerase sigma-70 factor (ECF subfamily)
LILYCSSAASANLLPANKSERPAQAIRHITEGGMEAMGQMILSEALLSADAKDREFEAAVREHGRHVYRVAQAVLRNHHDAEDAVQETYLRFLRQQRKWAGIRNPRAWLARTAWRVALDRRRQPMVVSLEDAVDVVGTLRSAGASAEQVAVHGQTLALVERLISSLPRELRGPLTLSTVEELTSAEIGEVLGIPEGSVRERVSRARTVLSEKLAGLMEKDRGR